MKQCETIGTPINKRRLDLAAMMIRSAQQDFRNAVSWANLKSYSTAMACGKSAIRLVQSVLRDLRAWKHSCAHAYERRGYRKLIQLTKDTIETLWTRITQWYVDADNALRAAQ